VYVGEHVSDAAARQCRVLSKRNRKYSAWQGASQMQALAGFWENEQGTRAPRQAHSCIPSALLDQAQLAELTVLLAMLA